MFPLYLEVVAYSKEINTCTAKLTDGQLVEFDPFVSCAIELTDEQYGNNVGFKQIGKRYILSDFSVEMTRNSEFAFFIVPAENGLHKVGL